MLKKGLVVVLVVCAGIASAGTVPSEIKTRYKQLEFAMKGVDMKAFATFFAPDFVNVSPAGEVVKRKVFLNQVGTLMEGTHLVEGGVKLKSATKMKGGVVAVKFDLNMTLHKKDGKMAVHEVGTDYWKKIGGHWVFVKTVDTLFTVK